jgi:hypothetical protein
MKIIDTKYNGNLLYFKQAENDYNNIKKLSIQIEKTQECINASVKPNNTEHIKYTYINLNNNIIAYDYIEAPGIILGYNLENLAVKRILPKSLSSFIDKCKFKDYKQHSYDKYDEISKVYTWVKNRILDMQFNLKSISLDRKNGKFEYNTTVKDSEFGTIQQFITARIDRSRNVRVTGTDLYGKPYEIANNYHMLFSYFMMFGFTEFYAKCTCNDYVKKYNTKIATQNYLCPHILYSLTQLPYYLMYTLE